LTNNSQANILAIGSELALGASFSLSARLTVPSTAAVDVASRNFITRTSELSHLSRSEVTPIYEWSAISKHPVWCEHGQARKIPTQKAAE